AGGPGLPGFDADARYGGGGVADFRYSAVLIEELCAVGAMSVVMNLGGFNDLVGPYLSQLGSEDQKERCLPALCAGRLVSAIAMSEPAAGSDLRAIRSTAVRDG